jgi:surface protein
MRVPFGFFKSTAVVLPFILTFRTTTPSQSIELAYEVSGTYSGTINWGDGNTSVNSYANRTHAYTTPGDYVVTITGNIINWSTGGSNRNILSIQQFGSLKIGNTGDAFAGQGIMNLSTVSDVLDLTGVTNLSGMFRDCLSITSINNLGSWDVSNVTNMAAMFSHCDNFNQNAFTTWNTSNVTNMLFMFYWTTSFNHPLPFNTSKVTTMYAMFRNSAFNQPVNMWDTSKVTDMSVMFEYCAINQDLSSWDVTSVTSGGRFLTGKSAGSFNPIYLTNMYNAWSLQAVKPNVSFNFGSIKYTAGGTAGKLILTSAPNNWVIIDGGI